MCFFGVSGIHRFMFFFFFFFFLLLVKKIGRDNLSGNNVIKTCLAKQNATLMVRVSQCCKLIEMKRVVSLDALFCLHYRNLYYFTHKRRNLKNGNRRLYWSERSAWWSGHCARWSGESADRRANRLWNGTVLFWLKLSKKSYLCNHLMPNWWIKLIPNLMLDLGLKFCTIPVPPTHYLEVKVIDFEMLWQCFGLNFLKVYSVTMPG